MTSTAISCHFFQSAGYSTDIYIYRSGLYFWVKCAEVAVLLKIANAKSFFKLVDSHYLSEYDEIRPCPDISPLPLSINCHTLFINQAGLYILLSKCRNKMPIAPTFRQWIDGVLHDLYKETDDDDDATTATTTTISPPIVRRKRSSSSRRPISLLKALQMKLMWTRINDNVRYSSIN